MHDEAYEISHIYTLFKINKFWKEHLLLLFCVEWNLWSRLTKCNTFSMKKKVFRYFDTFSGSSLSMYVILEKKRMATNVIYCRGISQNRMFRRRVCLSLSGSSFFSLLKHFQQHITCWRLLCFEITFCWLRFVFIFFRNVYLNLLFLLSFHIVYEMIFVIKKLACSTSLGLFFGKVFLYL